MSEGATRPTPIRTRPCPRCPICGHGGEVRHDAVKDHWFGTPGTWTLRECGAPTCGALWLDPAPHPDDLPLVYANYYTHEATPSARVRMLRPFYRLARAHYLARRFGYPSAPGGAAGAWLGQLLRVVPGAADLADRTVMHLPARENGRLLDLGCGDGARVRTLVAGGWNATGLDFDEAAVAAGRAAGLDLRAGTLWSESFPEATFDAITMSHTIEHLPDVPAALRECHRLMKAGGILSIVTPNARSLGHAAFGPVWRGLEPPRHLQVFTRRGLETAITGAGFGVIRSWTSADAAPFIFRESAKAGREGVHRGSSAASSAGGFAARERRALRQDPCAGEEIVLLASR